MDHPHVKLCMPAGPLGAIIKPLDWRPLNDNKRFVKDWLGFIHPLKIRRRSLMAVRNWFWEREKNEMRRIWFSLSKYEQDRYFSMRDIDKTISNVSIQMMKDFKGPKYQQGNMTLFPAGTTAASGSGLTLALDAANNFATNIDVDPPGPLNAGFGVIRDGTHDRTNSGGTNQINSAGDWVTPRTSTVGDDYEVIWNITSSFFNDENYTEDVWTTINVTGLGRYVGHSASTPSVFKTFEIDIGDVGTSTSDVNQDYSVECGDLI